MRFRALACDYDGTLATHDRLTPLAVDAVGRARAAGLLVFLVTGRTLFDLTRVCAHLELFDAVVAENGGVLYVPRDGAVRDTAPPPSPRVLAELDRRGVPFDVGRVIVATTSRHRDAVLEALAAAAARLQLVSNRAALMLLPPFVSKGSGLAAVLAGIGVSPRGVLALGDAENDLALFESCGWSACAGDAVPELKARADWVLPGTGPDAVARAIVGPILDGTLPPAVSGRDVIALGWASTTAEPVGVPAREANILLTGDALSGKSSLVGGLVERIAGAGDSVCVLDPEGDYEVLRGLPNAVWTRMQHEAAWDDVIATFVKNPAATVVADLTMVPDAVKRALAAGGLTRLRGLREQRGVPHWIVVDEAHDILPPGELRDATAFCLATYRGSRLMADTVKAIDVAIVGRTTRPEELSFLQLAGAGEAVARIAATLPAGTFVLHRAGERAVTFIPAARTIGHVRHLRKYVDHGVSPAHRFVFRTPDGPAVGVAATLTEFHHALAAVDAAVVAWHAARGDFSRWVRDVFRDTALAAQLAKLERRTARGDITDAPASFRALVTPLLSAPGTPSAGGPHADR